VCDITLLVQVYYYRWKRNHTKVRESGEEEPLLPDALPSIQEQSVPTKILVLRYGGALAFVILTGVIAWAISSSLEHGNEDGPIGSAMAPEWVVQLLGWISAVSFVSVYMPRLLNMNSSPEGAAGCTRSTNW
jgi:solute carrier family 66 (lysosomal lysine-arginine transporter), member 1